MALAGVPQRLSWRDREGVERTEVDHALAAGLEPSGLIGDLDSVTDEGLTWAARNATITRHPTDKEQTDTELALALAVTMDPEHLTLIGGGDRLDHTVAGIGALGALALTSIPTLDAWWGGQHISVVHGPGKATLRLLPGSTMSLLAMHGPCTKVTLTGTRWELDEIDLDPVVGLGVSNEVTVSGGEADEDNGGEVAEVEVSLSGGILTIFDHPAVVDAESADEETGS